MSKECWNCSETDETKLHWQASLEDYLCETCENSGDNKTGYCSMFCQLTGECDNSC